MAKPRNKIVDIAQYIGLRLFATVVQMFSPASNYRTARWIGEFLWRYDSRHRRRAIEHLRRSFPDWPQEKIDAVACQSMHHMVYLALEVLLITRLITPQHWRRHIVIGDNMVEAIELFRCRTGLIILTGHYGNWEVSGYTLAALGFPSVAVARPLDNRYVNHFIMGVREARGMRVVDKKGATSEIDDVLDHRGVVGFVADQDAGKKGLFVDFFGRPASTYKAIGLLAMRHRVPIIVGYARRLDESFRFELGDERIIYPESWELAEDPLRYITQEYTSALESAVRRAPEQYLWVHRRWKHRPRGEQGGRDGIA